MRRLVGIASIAALAGALYSGHASAAAPAPAAAFDLRPQLMLRLFGETGDSRAELAAAYGDRASESPLRGMALGAPATRPAAQFVADSGWVPSFSALAPAGGSAIDLSAMALSMRASYRPSLPDTAIAPVAETPAPAASAARGLAAPAAASFTVGAYEPVAPVTLVSPEPGAFSFGLLEGGSGGGFVPPVPSSLSVASAPAGSQRAAVVVPQTFHVGPAQFQVRVEGASVQAPQAALDDQAYGAGANFDVRAGHRKVNVDVSSSYEHLARNDISGFSAESAGTTGGWELPGDDVPLAVPSYADLSKVAVGANVAVPVVHNLTLNFNYGAERLLGAYGLPGVANLDGFNNSYGGGLTFSIPRFSSTLSVSARQQHYQDNLLPANSQTTTRADLNLTVKF